MDGQTLGYLHVLRTESYIHAGCIALWCFEYTSTLFSEVQLLWFSSWSITKVLFLLMRYMQAFLVGSIVYQGYTPHRLAKNDCFFVEKLVAVLIRIGMFLSEVIFTLRTWAVWGKCRRGGIWLTLAFFVVAVPCFVPTIIWLPTFTLSPVQVPRQVIPSGCGNTIVSALRLAEYISISIFHLLNVTLLAVRAHRSFINRKSLNSFARLVYRDGIMYYLYLILFDLLNIIIIIVLPPHYSEIFTVPQEFLGSILSCRMILNLRAHHDSDSHGLDCKPTPPPLDTLLFRSYPTQY